MFLVQLSNHLKIVMLYSLIILGFSFVCGLSQKSPQHRFNFRDHCFVQHSGSRYSATCDGSNKGFKEKDLALGSSNIFGMDEIVLFNFNSLYFSSLAEIEMRKFVIKDIKHVTLDTHVPINVKELYIDSVEKLTFKSIDQQFLSGDNVKLSNINKLNIINASSLYARMLNLTSVKDFNFESGTRLHLSGESFIMLKNNIELKENSFVNMEFRFNVVLDHSVLYVQKNATLNISTNEVSLFDSELFVDGYVNITGHDISEQVKSTTKSCRNSFYNFGRKYFQINDIKHVEFLKNDIFNSEISSVVEWISNIWEVRFVHNKFGCNKCTNVFIMMSKDIADTNYCYTNCNLSLSQYSKMLEEQQLCNNEKLEVDYDTLCSRNNVNTDSIGKFGYLLYILVFALLLTSIVSLISIYIYYKRKKKEFKPLVLTKVPPQMGKRHTDQQTKVLAFRNNTYASGDPHIDLGQMYELVEPPGMEIS